MSFCGKLKEYLMSIYTQSNNGKRHKINHSSFYTEQKHNAPYIVICDLGTVLDLCLLHNFTYSILVYLYTWTYV